jgi:hypothetical protein
MLGEYCNSFVHCIAWPHEPALLRLATDGCSISNLEECSLLTVDRSLCHTRYNVIILSALYSGLVENLLCLFNHKHGFAMTDLSCRTRVNAENNLTMRVFWVIYFVLQWAG